ncbi:ATP-binding protein [Microcoleus sp. F10-C6]|uniref:ATP-binding protein n=1 Tax=unclassified Microcoleus TaxID=2642155 RepID=UPI002FD12732
MPSGRQVCAIANSCKSPINEESNQGRNFADFQAHPNQRTILTKVEGEQVKIAIADSGNGISEELKDRIFYHLFTTKHAGQGTGFCLAIARQIVE